MSPKEGSNTNSNGDGNGNGTGTGFRLTMAASNAAQGLYSFTHRQVDRLAPPDSRQKAYQQSREFASERPILSALIVIQVLFTLIPALLFITFIGSTAVFAAGTALLFTLFWTGVALALLAVTFLVTGSAGICVWAWAVVSYLAVHWTYSVLQQGFAGGNTHNTKSDASIANNDGNSLSNGAMKATKSENDEAQSKATDIKSSSRPAGIETGGSGSLTPENL
ncbi:hypothetical protein B0T19DRAFT_194540 [Cercophora scortea]|uniref:Uncharacterized protein n=1 Tax=Cercophora scortea TaxID=314031 RepID=A0AAE0MDH2_9PEZI|nr:hypothetical protein B0T19DRAFT_194540 [Cercophora scortea]